MVDYQGRAPGVYVEERPAVGPIPGVGTSTAAFVGPAVKGPVGSPEKVTSWTRFTETFGEYLNARYLAHAVRGFFENGGTTAYVVRVGTATSSSLDLLDETGKAVLRVTARQEGPGGQLITVTTAAAEIVSGAKFLAVAAKPASGAGTVITLTTPDDARNFAAGDTVDYEGRRAVVARVRDGRLFLDSALPPDAPATGSVRTADLVQGQTTFRLTAATGVERGTVLQITKGATKESVVVDSVVAGLVTVTPGLANAYSLAAGQPQATIASAEFLLTVTHPDGTQSYDKLALDPRHSRHFAKVVDSPAVTVAAVPNTTPPPKNRPAAVATKPLAGGTADNPSTVDRARYVAALDLLATVDDISLVCVPDAVGPDAGVQADVIAHCERMKDRFAIVDPPRADQQAAGVLAHRLTVRSRYAALYYPWLTVPDPGGPGTIQVPPSGHLAGVYARSDAEHGVHKAPANEPISGAVGVAAAFDDVDQGDLNANGVNVLRVFGGGRPLVWGARTTSDDVVWRYVNVRRLLMFVEESLQEGLRWAVFQPNDLSLRKKLERTATEFLTRVWASGALFGATAGEAFYVKIDDENNPPGLRELGQVVLDIGTAPVRPAEFVVVRIGMSAGGGQVQEG
ncbi:phage tail sheath family protein [Lentzea sp. NPDC058450]|uniref:phage tail sheath family protein n=1 Tax=Lentzea sp. NPDC058450 TaxID=3346505 RepID=UPI0036646967